MASKGEIMSAYDEPINEEALMMIIGRLLCYLEDLRGSHERTTEIAYVERVLEILYDDFKYQKEAS